MKAILLAILCFMSLVSLKKFQLPAHDPFTSPMSVVSGTFNQKVDHYDLANSATFKQRYWISEDYYTKSGPLLVYICGESAGNFPKETTFFGTLMQSYKAIGVALEHRYYGESQPTTDWSLQNMQYLSHDQAIADLAYFISSIKDSMFKKYGISSIKTIVVGGSYAGALAAWARYKYPHLIDAALSSSGVVNAIENFHQFDEQVLASTLKSGDACPSKIQQLVQEVTNRMTQGIAAKYNLMSKFNAEFMEWDDFWFFFSDIFVENVQYGARTAMCTFLSTLTGTMDDQLSALAKYAATNRMDSTAYSFLNIRKESINASAEYRQWTFQYCSSLAYFNTPGQQRPLRWTGMDLYYWRRYCFKSYGDVVYPDTFNVNSLYGDVRVATAATHIYFTNAGEDPWQAAGIKATDAVGAGNKAVIMDCNDCGHCKDLHAADPSDPQIVVDTRSDIKATIEAWIKEASDPMESS